MSKNNDLFNADKLKEIIKEMEIIPSKETSSIQSDPTNNKNDNNTTDEIYNFNLKPTELANYLKNYIIEQDDTIDVVATKVCTHFNRMRYELQNPNLDEIIGKTKPNLLLIGPTGVGKTYMIKLIANKIGLPLVKADATKLTETGYVGGDAEDLVRALVNEAKGNKKLAEYGIIYIDEVDKIASEGKNYMGHEISKTGVQRNLLKIMEETEVHLKNPMDISSQIESVIRMKTNNASKTGQVINTKNILFILSGAFSKIDKIIERRLVLNKIGFKKQKSNSLSKKEDSRVELLKYITQQDLISFGFESEFIGRMPVIVTLNSLKESSLVKILQTPKNNIIESKKRDFASYNIKLEFQDSAFHEIARLAFKQSIGARALTSVIEKYLVKFENLLPISSISSLTITKDAISKSNNYLYEIILSKEIEEITEIFKKDFNITVKISEYLYTTLINFKKKNVSIIFTLKSILKEYHYGFKLLNGYSIILEKLFFSNTTKYIDDLLKKNK